ncbi:Brain protein 44 [Tupaia chinensis]|uniref:Brain protein 44 n=1 Tax=Tupaia chinensis TaxID=246437 RepID=L9KS66_TUPCH|nr:Brain protein 44 [Tupaia chinensis]
MTDSATANGDDRDPEIELFVKVETSTAGTCSLRATYHRLMDRVELMLPEKLRPLYNHMAGPRTLFFLGSNYEMGLVYFSPSKWRAVSPLMLSPLSVYQSPKQTGSEGQTQLFGSL